VKPHEENGSWSTSRNVLYYPVRSSVLGISALLHTLFSRMFNTILVCNGLFNRSDSTIRQCGLDWTGLGWVQWRAFELELFNFRFRIAVNVVISEYDVDRLYSTHTCIVYLAYNILVGYPEGKCPFGRVRGLWEKKLGLK